jgi:hypothetical protein
VLTGEGRWAAAAKGVQIVHTVLVHNYTVVRTVVGRRHAVVHIVVVHTAVAWVNRIASYTEAGDSES